jgi:hypothetical protein
MNFWLWLCDSNHSSCGTTFCRVRDRPQAGENFGKSNRMATGWPGAEGSIRSKNGPN